MTMVVLIIILLGLILFFFWILFSPFIFEIDTRTPHACLRWRSIGNVWIWYEENWWLSFRILFFKKKMLLSDLKTKKKQIEKPVQTKKKKSKKRPSIQKLTRIIQSFTIKEWQLAIDTGDYTTNARLYPINFLPYAFRHVEVNFHGDNYFYIKIQNNAWRILYAFLR